jgi:hypothetical protein
MYVKGRSPVFDFLCIKVYKRCDDRLQLELAYAAVNKLISSGVVCDWFDTCNLLISTGMSHLEWSHPVVFIESMSSVVITAVNSINVLMFIYFSYMRIVAGLCNNIQPLYHTCCISRFYLCEYYPHRRNTVQMSSRWKVRRHFTPLVILQGGKINIKWTILHKEQWIQRYIWKSTLTYNSPHVYVHRWLCRIIPLLILLFELFTLWYILISNYSLM